MLAMMYSKERIVVPDVPPQPCVVRCVGNRRPVYVGHEVKNVCDRRLLDGALLVCDLVLGLGGVVRAAPPSVRTQDVSGHPPCEVLQVPFHSVTKRIIATFVHEVNACWHVMMALIFANHVQKLLDQQCRVAGHLRRYSTANKRMGCMSGWLAGMGCNGVVSARMGS